MAGLRTETKLYGQFQQKSYVKIAEISLDCIEQKDRLHAPLIQSWFIDTFLKHTEKHLAHEHRHGVLEHIASDASQRTFRRKVPGGVQRRLG